MVWFGGGFVYFVGGGFLLFVCGSGFVLVWFFTIFYSFLVSFIFSL